MPETTKEELEAQITDLKNEHRALDEELSQLVDDHLVDDLQIQRLKKRKLHLKDSIAQLETELTPQITA
jgi:hypothetical protein